VDRFLLIAMSCMAIVAFLAGLACLFVPAYSQAPSPTKFKFGEHEVASTNVGVVLILVGVLSIILLAVSGLGRSAHDTSARPVPLPAPPASTGTGAPQPSSSTPPPLAGAAPWISESQGLTLVVEKATVSKKIPGREILTVRVENQTGFGIAMPTDGFVAVDDLDQSYGEDDPNSSLVFDATDALQSWQPGPFDSGTTRRGTVTLDSNLARGVQTLQIRLTVAYLDDNYETAHMTVAVNTAVPVGAS
jgi:hypothetical protein